MSKLNVICIAIYLICASGLAELSMCDTNSTDLSVLTELVDNEQTYVYKDSYYPLGSKDSLENIHSFLADYSYTKINASSVCNTVRSVEGAELFIDNTMPDNIEDSNSYVRKYVSSQLYYDLLFMVDAGCEDADAISSYAWKYIAKQDKVFEDILYEFVYSNYYCILIALCLIVVVTLMFQLGNFAICSYELRTSKKE